jgi:2-iminobutanoate/2-iminopropanoate deaminase
MNPYKLIFLLAFFILNATALAQPSTAIQQIETPDAPKVTGPYSQGLVVDLSKGKLLLVSGESEDDPKTGKRLDQTIKEATNQTMNNIEAILKAAGTSWENVVRVEVYLNDLNDWAEMNTEYKKRFPSGIYPARSAVQAKSGYRLEMTCVAFVPDK